ncbi:MAG: peptide chain release factor N(5)-glutamine methyltransferase [Dictyoglomaceae bacterium]|nr:peptide chain release factor N(5)-glutamine methyltransferase [Dictyoglomaceae bacterium]
MLHKAKKELEKVNPSASHLEAELLVALALNVERAHIYLFNSLNETQEKKFNYLLRKRLQGVPISYLQKKRCFYDLDLDIEEGVFIPRPETELLLEKSMEVIRGKNIQSLVEIGVGAGNIIIPLALRFPNLKIFGCDISPKALRIAMKNAKKYKVHDKINLFLGPYLFPILLRNKGIDLIVANPPYISSREMSQLSQDVKKEPWNALYGGFDGCNFYRELFKEVKILDKIIMILEISPFILDRLIKILSLYIKNFSLEVYKDFSNKERMLKIEWQSI